MFRIISALIPGWLIRSNCRLLNSIYLWAARGAYNEEEERDDRITWAIIWKKKAKSYRWLAHEYTALYNIQFAKVGRARAWSAAWKSSARASRRIAQCRADLADYRWDMVVAYIDLLSRKMAWARLWKTMAKAYRAISLSQQDALDRYSQWIDPGIELPEVYQTVAVLRAGLNYPFIVFAHRIDGNRWHQHDDPDWMILESEHIIGWYPLPELSRLDNTTGQT